jgi:hypothetical protein
MKLDALLSSIFHITHDTKENITNELSYFMPACERGDLTHLSMCNNLSSNSIFALQDLKEQNVTR